MLKQCHKPPIFWCFKKHLYMKMVTGGDVQPSGMISGLLSALSEKVTLRKWVCLKIGYIPNYSHLIGIMIISQSLTIGFRGTLFSDTPKYVYSLLMLHLLKFACFLHVNTAFERGILYLVKSILRFFSRNAAKGMLRLSGGILHLWRNREYNTLSWRFFDQMLQFVGRNSSFLQSSRNTALTVWRNATHVWECLRNKILSQRKTALSRRNSSTFVKEFKTVFLTSVYYVLLTRKLHLIA